MAVALPNPTPLVNADHLREWEDAPLAVGPTPEGQPEQPQPTITLQDAVESVRSIRYHERAKAEAQATADCLMAPLLEQLDMIQAWLKPQLEDRDRRIERHKARLVSYARLNSPANAQHVDVPGARIQTKQPADKWNYGDEKDLLKLLQEKALTGAIRQKPEIDKDALKKAALVEEGKIFMVNSDGEKVELPVCIVTPPMEYTVKLTEPKGAKADVHS